MAIAELGQCLRTHELQTLHGVVAVDLLHIELAHEVDGLLGDDLAGYHDRKTWRIGNDKTRGDQIGAVLQAAVDLRIAQADIIASSCVVGRKEAAADIALVSLLPSIAAEAFMEVREVRQIGHVYHEALDPGVERLDRIRATLGKIALDLAANLGQHPDEVGYVTPGVVDVGLDQHGIARGLVYLDSVTCG